MTLGYWGNVGDDRDEGNGFELSIVIVLRNFRLGKSLGRDSLRIGHLV